MVGLLTALPGTRLYRRLAAEGRLLEDTTGNNTHDVKLSFVTRMPAETLLAGYKRVLAEIYDPARYFERCAELMRRLPGTAKVVRRVTWSGLRALLLSLLKQGFSRYGRAYLSFLAGVVAHRPRLFPDAVAFAVKGYHFFAITRRILEAEALADLLARAALALRERVARVIGSGRARLARGMRRSIVRTLIRARRRHRALSADVQEQAARAFREFSLQCRLWLAALRALG
jgi:hypothetical protein